MEDGVYACWAKLEDDEQHPSTMHVGPRPTFNAGKTYEVHIMGITLADLPKKLTVTVVQKQRGIHKFASKEELIAQMERDKVEARAILDTDAPAA